MTRLQPKIWWLVTILVVGAALPGCEQDLPKAKQSASPSAEFNTTDQLNEASSAADEEADSQPAAADAPLTEATGQGGAEADPLEEGWGSLKGRFVYGGPAPAPTPVNVTKDVQFCGNKGLVDESLMVDRDGGLANVVVWVRNRDVKVHPSYEPHKKNTVTIDNKNCRFEPHVNGMWIGQSLEAMCSDPVGHNVNLSFSSNPSVSVIIPQGNPLKIPVASPEFLPVRVVCNIHPWMAGWLLVRPDPYFAISSNDGTFEIQNLPAEELEFQFWQEKSGYVQDVEVNGKPAHWKRGRFTMAIKPGVNDLGAVKISASAFSK